jgi:hypothetical protein
MPREYNVVSSDSEDDTIITRLCFDCHIDKPESDFTKKGFKCKACRKLIRKKRGRKELPKIVTKDDSD